MNFFLIESCSYIGYSTPYNSLNYYVYYNAYAKLLLTKTETKNSVYLEGVDLYGYIAGKIIIHVIIGLYLYY